MDRVCPFLFQPVPTFQSHTGPAQPQEPLGDEPLFVYLLSGSTVHLYIPPGFLQASRELMDSEVLHKQQRTRETCWRQLLSFLKKERREAEVKTVLSSQESDINILADTAEGGFIYTLKRINGGR